jgi:hypothetical protein
MTHGLARSLAKCGGVHVKIYLTGEGSLKFKNSRPFRNAQFDVPFWLRCSMHFWNSQYAASLHTVPVHLHLGDERGKRQKLIHFMPTKRSLAAPPARRPGRTFQSGLRIAPDGVGVGKAASQRLKVPRHVQTAA